MQPDSPDDLKELRIEHLYRESPRPEPSEDLDRAILAAARRETRARPQLARSVLQRWRVPVSIAAVVVLSVTVATLVSEHGGEFAEPPPPRPASPPPTLEQRQGVAPAEAPRERSSTTYLGESRSKAPAEAQAPAGVEAAVRPETQAPMAGSADVQPGRQEAVAPMQKLRDDALAGAGPEPRAPEPLPDAVPTPRAAKKAAVPQPQAAPARGALRSRPAENDMREQHVPTVQVEPSRTPMPASPGSIELAKALEGQPPERWLEKIEELRRSDRVTDADELLAAFRKRFPDHPGAVTQ